MLPWVPSVMGPPPAVGQCDGAGVCYEGKNKHLLQVPGSLFVENEEGMVGRLKITVN